MIVLSRFLARPQKRGRRNQLICRGLIKTKKSIGPSKQSDAWSLDDIRKGYWGPCEPYSRKNPRRATAPAYAQASIHARTLARAQARSHARSHARTHARICTVSLSRTHARTRTDNCALYKSANVAICAATMEKIMTKNGKIYVIYGGQKFRKDSELAGGGSSWRCVKPACRGRMKIVEDDKVLSSTEHNHAPEPEVEKDRQITTPAGKWMLVEPL